MEAVVSVNDVLIVPGEETVQEAAANQPDIKTLKIYNNIITMQSAAGKISRA